MLAAELGLAEQAIRSLGRYLTANSAPLPPRKQYSIVRPGQIPERHRRLGWSL